jgi:hypothetical protein
MVKHQGAYLDMGNGWRQAIREFDEAQRLAMSRDVNARTNVPFDQLARVAEQCPVSLDELLDLDQYAHLEPPRDPPFPSLIICGCRAWSAAEYRPCPACNDAPMKPDHYCARCDRWGRDGPSRRSRRRRHSRA